MRFKETSLAGVYEIEIEPMCDERGFFARTWCEAEFRDHGLDHHLTQCSLSVNRSKGTLRGMHYQAAPDGETKLVRCTRGAIYDVAVDLRQSSATFKKWVGIELRADQRNMLYIPKGCAHGFLTLGDDAEVFYQMSDPYVPGAGRGFRWNDEAFRIYWPADVRTISERDRTYADWSPESAQ